MKTHSNTPKATSNCLKRVLKSFHADLIDIASPLKNLPDRQTGVLCSSNKPLVEIGNTISVLSVSLQCFSSRGFERLWLHRVKMCADWQPFSRAFAVVLADFLA